MKHIMHILMLSCLKATELIEKRFHVKLSFKERLQLRMHLMMCEKCTRYQKQSAFLEKSIENLSTTHSHSANIDELKLKITKKIENLNEK